MGQQFDSHGNLRESRLGGDWRADYNEVVVHELEAKRGERVENIDTDDPGRSWFWWLFLIIPIVGFGLYIFVQASAR